MALESARAVEKDVEAEVSGKVFRFLSAMHPSLTRSERKRFGSYDPEKWYPWTNEVSSRFTELMRRSPRDTSFARGFAYAAQTSIPEGRYLGITDLLDNLDRLPGAFRGPDGSGFKARLEGPGCATVVFSGLPGFANACIAVAEELTQRLQAAGARGVGVRHVQGCRLQGAQHCAFEVKWNSEETPQGALLISAAELLDEPLEDGPAESGSIEDAGTVVVGDSREDEDAPSPGAASVASQEPLEPAVAELLEPSPSVVEFAGADPAAQPSPRADDRAVGSAGAVSVSELERALPNSGEDLFAQLKQRLASADRQAMLYDKAQAEIDSLKLELARLRSQHEASMVDSERRVREARAALDQLRANIRALVTDD